MSKIVKALFITAISVSCFMAPVSAQVPMGPCTTPCLENCDLDWICTDVPEPTCSELGGSCISNCGGNGCSAVSGGGNDCPPTTICCSGGASCNAAFSKRSLVGVDGPIVKNKKLLRGD